jgi:hypothetical protein
MGEALMNQLGKRTAEAAEPKSTSTGLTCGLKCCRAGQSSMVVVSLSVRDYRSVNTGQIHLQVDMALDMSTRTQRRPSPTLGQKTQIYTSVGSAGTVPSAVMLV